MPEITASTKVVLGIIAATAALITGLLGNVLAANISAIFSGTPPKTGRRPAILWIAFFVSASLSVLAGSFATFAPAAPPTSTPIGNQPKIVVTNVRAVLLLGDPKNDFLICRDTVELANTSDVATSTVAVGTEVHLDSVVAKVDPTETRGTWTDGTLTVDLAAWATPPASKNYQALHGLGGFVLLRGDRLPVRVDARSIATVYIDFAVKSLKAYPLSVSATHTLRFPDIKDIVTDPMQCK